jgi:SPP1 Gp6-like portal protein
LGVAYNPYEVLVDLDEALEQRQHQLAVYADYYNGDQPLLFASEKWRRAFGGLFTEFSDNWCQLVVDAVEERLDVTGFRFGDDSGDDDAWRIWQENGLDADSQIAHTDSLTFGVSYALVWADQEGEPKIDVESPFQTIVAYDPARRRTRTAAMKRWQDDERVFANLFMRDYIWKFRAKAPGGSKEAAPRIGGWEPREEGNEPWPLPNPLGVVPVVPLINRPRLLPRRLAELEGQSEIRQVIPVQDAVNKLLLDMLVASEFGAFRQRWVVGLDIPRNPETDEPIEPFKAAVDRLWMSENPETKFGEFGATDLTPYVKSVEMLVQHIASQTRTPPHYFYLSGQFPSGESIKSAETGLVAKARRKQRHFEEGWEELIRLGFRVLGDDRANYRMAETIWADPESRSEGEHTDATLKKKSLDVPIQQLWEDLGYSPQQINRFREMLAEQAFLAALAAPVVPEPQPAPVPPAR